MSETPGFKPKKSVALSGVTAGNTALCTVGRTGAGMPRSDFSLPLWAVSSARLGNLP